MSDLEKKIKMLKDLGEHLVPYNYPLVSQQDDLAVHYLKHMDVNVDGYMVQIHFNKADYGDKTLSTFQITGRSVPFLPFNLVLKTARKALGDKHLSLLEIYREKRKIYCWTLVQDEEGKPIPYPYEESQVTHLEYDGFEYTYMNPNQVNYY